MLDPGFGFGKNFEENYPLLAHLDQLQRLGFPILAGTSRNRSSAAPPAQERQRLATKDRIYGSLAAMVVSILRGAHIVRVHDVRAAVEAAAIADEIFAHERPANLRRPELHCRPFAPTLTMSPSLNFR